MSFAITGIAIKKVINNTAVLLIKFWLYIYLLHDEMMLYFCRNTVLKTGSFRLPGILLCSRICIWEL